MSSPEGYPESQSVLEQFPDSPPRPSWPPLKLPSGSPELNEKCDPSVQLARKLRDLKSELKTAQDTADWNFREATRLLKGIDTLVDGAREGSHWSRDDVVSFLLDLQSGDSPRPPSPAF